MCAYHRNPLAQESFTPASGVQEQMAMPLYGGLTGMNFVTMQTLGSQNLRLNRHFNLFRKW